MIVLTGGAGFIGSNLLKALNAAGHSDIVLVDDLADGHKALNLADCTIADYLDWEEALARLEAGGDFGTPVERVFHLGACSDTTAWDGRMMMRRNFSFSRALLEWCAKHRAPLVYASSAAVYGGTGGFAEEPANERPINVYGYSKLAFDQLVRQRLGAHAAPVIGLRYFNVYGPREAHKGRMASVVWHFSRQLESEGRVRLFEGSHGYGAGEQMRDFIHVDDAVAVTLWASAQPRARAGIYNCGTGEAATFNTVARVLLDHHGSGEIGYIPFPADLLAAYQAFTEADLGRLRAAGYAAPFRSVDQGVREYLRWLAS
ncbi:MAG: ADP-glyceromanno-heptose 6-epimerase [Gammaproteobacteria bacterium]